MPDNKLELVVEVDVDKANASIKGVNRGLSDFERTARNASTGASRGIDGFTVSVAKGAAAGAIFVTALEKALGLLKEVGLETVKYAARTETLGVVTDQLAKVNGYSAGAVDRLVERVKALGISTQEAHGVVQRMIFAQLDLSKATELARVAQNAAVISGTNSSEALENIIIGITTGQTRLLHNMGLQVSLEQVIQKGERELGRAMSEREKRAYMLNEVLTEGVKIQGAYEAAMTTAHKQMMSLTRYFQEARNAIGSEFLPEMNKAIQILGDTAKWLKENADAVAWWARALVDVAVGAAIAKFVMWIGGAKKAVDGLTASLARNPWTALIIATTVVGTKLYEAYQESKRFEEQLQKQTKAAGDAAHILYYVGEQGKTVEDLRKMGYSIDQIKAAFLGTTDAADKFVERMDNLEFKTGLKITNQADLDAEQARRAQELSREIAKKQAEIERSTFEAAESAERALVSGPGRALLDFADKARTATVFVDSKGNEHAMRLTSATIENLQREHAARVLQIQRKSVNETLDMYRQEAKERIALDTDVYRKKLEHNVQIANANLDHVAEMYRIEEDEAAQARDAQLRAVESADARSVEQKIAVEQRKAEIEIDYLERTNDIKMRLFDLETSRMTDEAETAMKLLGYTADQVEARIAEITQQRDAIRQANQAATDAAVSAARENAANRAADAIRDQNQKVFDSFKQQAEGVFDALLTKSESVWSAIGNAFKTAMLTAIKEIVTSRVAAMLMQLFGAARGGYAPSGAAAGNGAGWATVLGGFGGLGGVLPGGGLFGSGPVNGNPMVLSAAGGLGGFPIGSGATGVPMGSSGSGLLGGLLGGKGAGLSLGGLQSFLGFGGGVQYAPGMATTWAASTMGQKLSALGRSNAALMGGALLAFDGLRRGGALGVAETTAGGALIGFKFGGPLGAAIGAGVGFAAGIVRLFVKGAQEKAREKIKATYGVDIPDKNILSQIVNIAKQAYGGNLDMAIRTQQVRDIVELYAMSTGQPTAGLPGTVKPMTLAQSGGSLFQSSGGSLTGLGASVSVDRIGAGAASGAGAVVIQLDGPATTALLRGEAVQAIADNPRAVQGAALKATRSNAGRRQMTTLQMSPGLITA